MELPSIEDILADLSTAGKEYLDNEAEIRDSVRELESLDLPEIISGPPKPPILQVDNVLKEYKEKRKLKKKKNNKALVSFQILPSDTKTKTAFVSKEVDTGALERVLASRKNTITSKPYEIINASSSSSGSEDEKIYSRINMGKMDGRISAWRGGDSLKLLK